MSDSGFEGFEKRLELRFRFFNVPFVDDGHMGGLRLLPIESLEEILRAVQCTVVSSMGNRFFDSYVLSESSLFVYPTKIVVKTCGTTQLLKSIAPLLSHARGLGLELVLCRYSRGSFIFPKSQPFPHTSFEDEVVCLEESLPSHLGDRKASVMPSNMPNLRYKWHVFVASAGDHDSSFCCPEIMLPDESFTIEVCMTQLDLVSAHKFYRPPDDQKTSESAGKEMTEATGIQNINPKAIICDFAFDPCGYSMNGIDGDRYSTIHVTPEDGFSYASYEWVGSIYDDRQEDITRTLMKVARVFRPGNMSVSTTSKSPQVWQAIANALEPIRLRCRSYSVDEFPGVGVVAFHAFTACRKG